MHDAAVCEDRGRGQITRAFSGEEGDNVRVLAERVRARAGSSSDIQFIPYDQAYGAGFEDMARRIPDVSKITSAIGWQASRSLEEIIDSVIAHQRRTGES